MVALARTYGNTAGHRRPRYAVNPEKAAPAATAAQARSGNRQGRDAQRLREDLAARDQGLRSDRRGRPRQTDDRWVRPRAEVLGNRRPPVEIIQPTDRPPAEATAGNRLLSILLFIAGLATSVSLWLFDTQPGAINDSATLLVAAGRVTGLIGGYLLFIQLLMMSRVSWLEEWVGARDLLRWHRWLGTALLAFVTAHIVFIVAGYAKQSNTGFVDQTWTMITTYQDMLSATIATGVVFGIGLLAVRQIRKRLPYELWHLLHSSAYLVLLLGYGHQVATGADLSGRFASIFWPGLGALVAAALLWGRVVEPLHLNLKHRFTVAKVIPETASAFSIYLTGRHLDRMPAQAGQFLRWRFLNRDGWWQSHPFSLSAAPNERWLRLTVTAVGTHTDRLIALRPGTQVWAEGPFGTFTAQRRTRRKALLVAGGSGIAPIRALLETMPPDTRVIYRASAADDLVFRDELDTLAKRRGGKVTYVVGARDDPGPQRLFSAEGLRALVPDVQRRDVYLCGPPGLVDATVDILRDLDVPVSQMHLDPFEF
ncbi:MAG TPA: ferric reductase-like transmembrane domain-containing protein [Actinoplanes sp.]|nr:ferric reductase-like transmembrane domain-containing protein [Actinoplanes sp.]